ncbi:MAG: hypothetical protein CM1200mP10_18210 [Candidatus Neomarinimicrobiota bacterium]|nr:MAG: hypothetical protein CM1200mP10_18210 [Candidatus Neomarinimicrobiota bacterium]
MAKIKVITDHKITGSKITITYRIYGNGLIDIQQQLKTGNKKLPKITKIRNENDITKRFQQINLVWGGDRTKVIGIGKHQHL